MSRFKPSPQVDERGRKGDRQGLREVVDKGHSSALKNSARKVRI